MSSLALSGILLGQIEKWQQMGRDFRTDRPKLDPTILIACFGILLAIVCGIWLLSRLLTRQEGRRLFNSPRQLFRGLCGQHELSRTERRLLKQVARFENIEQPASLFLQPEAFDIAARHPEFAQQVPQLRDLCRRLFEGLPPAVAVASAS
jgi:hypothetical protein